jgi:hypothetical protein
LGPGPRAEKSFKKAGLALRLRRNRDGPGCTLTLRYFSLSIGLRFDVWFATACCHLNVRTGIAGALFILAAPNIGTFE